MKIYAREIVAGAAGKINFSAPNWNQEFKRRVTTASNGENGENGINGPEGRS